MLRIDFNGYYMDMKKLFLFFSLLVFPLIAQAQTQATNQRRNTTLTTIAFGSVAADHSAFLTNASGLTFLDIDMLNWTDAEITCSYDAGVTDNFVVPAYSSYEIPLAKIKLHHATAIWCKRSSGAPTVGSVRISAGYLE